MYRHSGPSLKDFYLSRVRFRVGIFFFNSIPGDPKQQPGLKTILRKLPEKKKISSSFSSGVRTCTPFWNSQNLYKEILC